MSQDVHGQYTGKMFGQDRIGHTTPDLEASDAYRPWLPVAFPAPYLPGLRQDQGHPKAATKVLSSQMAVGLDKSGALVPAGLFCGKQANGAVLHPTVAAIDDNVLTLTVANKMVEGETFTVVDTVNAYLNGQVLTAKSGTNSTTVVADFTHGDATPSVSDMTIQSTKGGEFCILHYGAGSIDAFAVLASTGAVATANAHVVLAAPNDAVANMTVTLPDGTVVTVSAGDITFAHACDLFPTGVARPIGLATRDVYQYIGGTTVKSTTGGILYTLDPMNPIGFQVHNYTHEMGTAIQTSYVVRVPFIGASRTALATLAANDSVTGYAPGYGLSFTHFTGAPKQGGLVVAARGLQDAGNFASYDADKHDLADVCGRVLGVINMVDKIGYMARVKTLWDPSRLVGPYKDPNSASIMMGGSATGGLPYDINLTTDGLYKLYKNQQKSVNGKPELGTYVLIRINL
ncbi:hypothetical protein D4R30_01090 [archaeon]|nr:MAG: hypothetical protein D4R30_01090 [archaeon]